MLRYLILYLNFLPIIYNNIRSLSILQSKINEFYLMFVEYLFEINPLTLLLIMISAIIFVYRNTKTKKNSKVDIVFENIPIEYKSVKKVENPESSAFLVMSYNIMAYNFTKIEWFPYCNPEYLHPKYRAPRILNEISQTDPDVLLLQECDHDLFLEFYKVNLEDMGYKTVYMISNTNRIVTNVVAYKKKAFTLDSYTYLDLNEGLEKLDEVFQKHKEALILVLTHTNTGRKVVVTNTHLFWNPDFEFVKYGQISKILNYLSENYQNMPHIIGGDMNSMPSSNVLRYVYKLPPVVNVNQKGDFYKNKKYMEMFYNEKSHNFALRSAYDVYRNEKRADFNNIAENHPEYTTFTHEFVGTLDYLFYTDDKIEVTDLLKCPTNDPEIKNMKLPNHKFPSDHLKVAARFNFV